MRKTQTLGSTAWEQFPTLEVELPQTNGGVTLSSAAVQMLVELALFSEQAELPLDRFFPSSKLFYERGCQEKILSLTWQPDRFSDSQPATLEITAAVAGDALCQLSQCETF